MTASARRCELVVRHSDGCPATPTHRILFVGDDRPAFCCEACGLALKELFQLHGESMVFERLKGAT